MMVGKDGPAGPRLPEKALVVALELEIHELRAQRYGRAQHSPPLFLGSPEDSPLSTAPAGGDPGLPSALREASKSSGEAIHSAHETRLAGASR